MQVLKQRYNDLLKRELAGEAYLNDASIPLEERLKWEEPYKAILRELNDLLSQIGSYSPDEILRGFDIQEVLK
jgi:hypothetical protein